MSKTFMEKIRSKQPTIGTILTLDSPEIAEIASGAGLDWLFIDTEHGTITEPAAQHMLQATRPGCSPIVRVAENTPLWIQKVLDLGPEGIIVPLIRTVEDAQSAVDAAKYPPLGSRTAALARAHNYGLNFDEYVKHANDTVALIIQVEHIDAVKNLDAILAIKGIDGILIGPYDLSGSMNMLGQVASQPVQEAIAQIKTACTKKDMPWGIPAKNAQAARAELDSGAAFVAVSLDTTILAEAIQSTTQNIKGKKS